jgi:hypothetical protein
MTQPSASACASIGACACVVAVLTAALVASPTGLLVLVAFLSFASLPALAGTVLEAFAARALLRGARPVAQLIVSAVLLAPGAALTAWIGVNSLGDHEDMSPGTRAACRIGLVLGPLAWGLAVIAALLVLVGPAPRWSANRVIAWTAAAVLVVGLSVLLGRSVPGQQ